MRLSWNEIRARAARFADEWSEACYEKGETQSFYNDFFDVFGVKRRRVASFEQPVKLLGKKRGFIDLFWKGVLLVEQKSAGRDLKPAKVQALEYFPGLKESELPRYILLSDFQNFELYDLDEDTEVCFTLAELPKYVEAFGFILGVQKRTFRDQDPVNIEASELMGKLHDALKASGYVGHDLERFLVRLLFCLFADDTGIFEPRDIFETLIRDRTNEDGSDVGPWLSNLFEVLNTPEDKRQKKLDEDLKQFPYVNGDLFAERLPIPAFDSEMRKRLIEACEFSWDAISPAIFGSLFQSVMNAKERRASGAHYTTERNILKVVEPLFLDNLWAEFNRLKARRDNGRSNALRAFQARLGGLKFFDPACGCGNFLIIAYRELRSLELAVLKELNPKGQRTLLDVATLSKIDVNQFYGIEIGEFPARIAEVALWMMDHIMNNHLSLEFGESYARIPLKASPHIHHGDALETDWTAVLPPSECSYVFGNPPFVGAKYQTEQQRAQVRQIAQLGGSGGTLDYVSAWFLKAGAYVQGGQASIGFVATNSITQGEQVAQLWPQLFDRYGLEIAFAHRTFAWGSDARGVAHVHVVIIGLVQRAQEPQAKRLFSYDNINSDPVESQHGALTAYLFDASQVANRHLVVEERARPLCDVPRLVTGTQPIDDGNYIFNEEERRAFLAVEPGAARLLRPFPGGVEYINGIKRWILCLKDVSPKDLRNLPHVVERMRKVKAFRAKSQRKSTLAIADYPERYNVELIPQSSFLAIPEVSSERREYIPIGWLKPPAIPSNKLRVIVNGDLWLFGVLTSRMHMAWTRYVGGRLKSDFQYSVGVNYNAFPWPEATEAQREKIRKLAKAVLDARASFAGATLADLYDADVMRSELRKAHRALDVAVDKLYRSAAFSSDRERVEHLFGLYEELVSPLTSSVKPTKKRRVA
ncbi:class I SAM-dependent DNA methyltransferase [Microvirga sp. 2TAF3]|uniref:class I SAM-dependent DNA methyltransferase n=1 Tax=Microvirga sp. 2TAF3 TaxID=3233014 RepID=UPI003F95FF43